jgi:uncharacterized protein (DUF1800 family)
MASLNKNNAVLGSIHARHLIRRATFVYSKALIDKFSKLTPSQALDLLLVNQPLTINLPYDPLPGVNTPDGYWTEIDANYVGTRFRKVIFTAGWWWYNAVNSPTLKYKLAHFLSTRFSVEKSGDIGTASDFYDHVRLLLFHAYGNYKTLAKRMTLDNSMLLYLNNNENRKNSPNENYARELLELFTIGKGPQIAPGNYTNYTESDIVEAAKVLTGIRRRADRTIKDPVSGIPMGENIGNQHNTASKKFSSAFNNTVINSGTGSAGMDAELSTFIDMIFNQKATALNISRKIYTYFVRSTITPEIENDIIAPLANDLFSNGYELTPVIRRLLESQHFYDLDDAKASDEIIGGMIKSPIQQISEICSFFNVNIPNPDTKPLEFYTTFWRNFAHDRFLSGSNMLIFDPDNVAGHPAYHQSPGFDKNWISSSTLIARYKIGESIVEGKNKISNNNANIALKIDILSALKKDSLVSDPSDAFLLTGELCKALFGQEPSKARIAYFTNTYLLQGADAYNWTDAWDNFVSTNNASVVEPKLKLLLTKLLSSPESQVF